MKKILLLLFIFTFTLSFAQNKDFKFGKVSDNEIKLTEVPFEKSANAVILYEEGKLDLSPSNYYLTVKRRIKILNEKGMNPNILRVSVGVENIEAIIRSFDSVFEDW